MFGYGVCSPLNLVIYPIMRVFIILGEVFRDPQLEIFGYESPVSNVDLDFYTDASGGQGFQVYFQEQRCMEV